MKKTEFSKSTAWKTGVSTSLFNGLTVKNIDDCSMAGIDCVEVCLLGNWFESLKQEDRGKYCRMLAEKGEELGIGFWSVHLPFGHKWDISNQNDDMRNEIVNKHIELLEFATVFKPQKAVIHASYEPIRDEEREQRIAACRSSLKALAEKAYNLGIQLAVECLPRTCIGNTSEEIMRLIDGIDKIGVCCDTNHMLRETAEEFIDKLGARIVTLHVSDYDGIDERHWIPGKGLNDWNAIIKSLENAGYRGPFMFELSHPKDGNPITPFDVKKCWLDLLNEYIRNYSN